MINSLPAVPANRQTHLAYRADIDGLRAIAVVAVLLFHGFPARFPAGFVGVDIFFVISGYLISNIIFSELDTGSFSIVRFYERRVRRIFPALLVVLIACCVVGWIVLLADEYAQLGKHVFGGATFISNLLLWGESGYFDSSADTKPLLHLWSLGIEEQFYLFWPVILYFCYKRKRNLFAITITIALASFCWNLAQTPAHQTAAFYSPLSRFWELLVGAALAWWQSRFKFDGSSPTHIAYRESLSWAGLLLLVSSLVLINKQSAFPGFWALLPVGATAAFIFAGPKAWLNRFVLSNRLMVGVGLTSYPLYLWHWPLLSFARILENQTPSGVTRLSLLCVALALAWVTYVFIEKPIRALATKSSVLVRNLLIVMAVVAVFGDMIFLSNGFKARSVVVDSAEKGDYAEIKKLPSSSCLDVGVPLDVAQFCTRHAQGQPSRTMVLWGDSSAISLLPVFGTIAAENNYALILITHPSCPPILRARKTTFAYEQSKSYCADGQVQQSVVKAIQILKPDLIVVTGAWEVYSKLEFLTNISGEVANAQSTERVFQKELPKTIQALSQIANVLVIKPWPLMPRAPSKRVIETLGMHKQEVTVSRAAFAKDLVELNQIFDNLNAERVKVYDPAFQLCDEIVCHTEIDDLVLYSDTHHLSGQGVMRFKADLERLVVER